MARGKSLNHKKKSHPGEFPEGAEMKKTKVDKPETQEYLGTHEAFKNRVKDEE
ncbi:hypothetical protein QA612_19825 [Evansella sp. AB-P1]|uniref:hypothetical protein n=1 Tax=Evansella sp. AB-P1 TaxID=3037653 RepID=UPI00241D66D9|nr:hypothetical protein [Evansella sp. AB-P1]MDG5789710.1 hypothetical protein [Evansella sp. AB-P1]